MVDELMDAYYEREGIVLYRGDSLEVMAGLPDASVDMVLCDLPYGTTNIAWDSAIPLAPLWEQYGRLVKPGGAIALFASQPFTSVLGVSNLRQLRCEWIWEKSTGTGFLNANRHPLKCHESILVFCDRQPPYFPIMTKAERVRVDHRRGDEASQYGKHGRTTTTNNGLSYPRSVLYFPKVQNSLHPTQKPLGLCEYLIATYTQPGALVLDNCAGSGTTLRAAKNLQRQAIGIELEERYCEIAVARLSQEALPLEVG